MKYLYFLPIVAFGCSCFLVYGESEKKKSDTQISPYGVCAHLNRWEFPQAREEMALMREAGIACARTDLDWNRVEKEKGNFDFSQWDTLVEYAKAEGVEFLSIIPGGTPKFAKPFPRHAEEMAASSEKIVRHFKGKIKYWEMVNEPNHHSFWGGLEPNAAEYREVIKKLYPAIKKGNPDAVVLYGGLAGTPMDYIEETFKEGGAKYFDVMNIHPYSWAGVPEDSLVDRINQTRAKMEKYGVGHKPIWITEVGYSSGKPNPCLVKYMERSLKILGFELSKIPVAFISDEKYGFYCDAFLGDVRQIFPTAKRYKRFTFEGLKKISNEKYPVLYIGQNESFPKEYLEYLYEYARNGGTIVSSGGIPFYYNIKINENGNAVRVGGNRENGKIFRIANRTKNDADTKFVEPFLSKKTGGFRGDIVKKESAKGFEDIEPIGKYGGRLYVSDKYLGAEDKFIPIVYGVFGDKKIPCGAIYKYGGDMKGAFVVMASPNWEHASVELQGKMLPRIYILARSAGVQRIFKYNFRSNENTFSRESHFGIVKRNLEPKPSYIAYKTLTTMLGNSIPIVEKLDGYVYVAHWQNHNGEPICAIWTKFYKKRVSLEFSGEVKEVVDYLGKPVSYSSGEGRMKLNIDAGICYIIGVKNVKLSK